MSPFPFSRALRALSALSVIAVASGCAGFRGGQQSLLDLTRHLEGIATWQQGHQAQYRAYAEQLPNPFRVAGTKRAALVMTVEGEFVALAWYENGKGPVCKMESIGTRYPFPITCTNEAGETIYDSRVVQPARSR